MNQLQNVNELDSLEGGGSEDESVARGTEVCGLYAASMIHELVLSGKNFTFGFHHRRNSRLTGTIFDSRM